MKSLSAPARVLALGLTCLAPSFALAGDGPEAATAPPKPADATKPPESSVSAGRINAWLKDLESDSYADRRAATNHLTRAGKPAIEGLTRTAETSFDLEVPSRCVKILGTFLRGDDEATSAAAKAALETLAESDRKFIANRANDVLKGPEEPAPANPFGGGVRIVVDGVRAGGGTASISQSTANGVRTTEVKVNGRKIRVTDTDGRNIAMKVTDSVAGNEVTKEYAGDDLADLNKKHPEAAQLYEQYVAGNAANPFGGLQRIQVGPNGQIQIAPGAFPALPIVPAPNVPPIRMPFVPRANVDEAVEQLDKSLESLDELEKSGQLPEESLDEIRKQLGEVRRLLEAAG